MQKSTIRSVGKSIGLTAVVSGLAAAALTDILFHEMLSREGIRRRAANGNAGMDRLRAAYGDAAQKGFAFIRSTPRETVAIKASSDGVRCRAIITMRGIRSGSC